MSEDDTIRIPLATAHKAALYLTKAHVDGAFKGCAAPMGGIKTAERIRAAIAEHERDERLGDAAEPMRAAIGKVVEEYKPRFSVRTRHTFGRERDYDKTGVSLAKAESFLRAFAMDHGKEGLEYVERFRDILESAYPGNSEGLQPYYSLDLGDDGITIRQENA